MKNTRLLIVDDDPNSLEIIKIACAGLDCQVDVANNGNCAVKLAKRYSYALLLTDYKMPNLDGIDLVLELRRTHPNLECIIYTGHSDERIEEFSQNTNDCTYLRKPVNLAHLVDLLKQSLFTKHGDTTEGALDAELQNCAPLAGQSSQIRNLRSQIANLQYTHHPVLIEGADFSSRRMVAHQVHTLSRRKSRKLIEHSCHHNENQAVWNELIDSNRTGDSLISSAVGSSLLLNDLQYLNGAIQRRLAEEFHVVFENIRLMATVDYPHTPDAAATYSIYLRLYSLISETLIELPSLPERQEDIPSILASIAQQPEDYQIQHEFTSDEIMQMIQQVPRTKPLQSFDDCIRHVAYFAGGTDGRVTAFN